MTRQVHCFLLPLVFLMFPWSVQTSCFAQDARADPDDDPAEQVPREGPAQEAPSPVPDPDPYYLRYNPKLRVDVRLFAESPELSDLLTMLREATGLKLELSEGLTDYVPNYGSLQLDTGPAFTILEIIAEMDLEGGRWEKIPGGYRLQGTPSAASLARAKARAQDKARAAAAARQASWAPWATGLSVAVLIGGSIWFLASAWRRWNRPAVPPIA